jgi:hypothetical protein
MLLMTIMIEYYEPHSKPIYRKNDKEPDRACERVYLELILKRKEFEF